MLHVVPLLLALAAAQDTLTIQGSLKELPAEGKDGPAIACEGTANLPNGCVLSATLYYGEAIPGRELAREFVTVKNGAFSHSYSVYPKRNFPGNYTLRVLYEPDLQSVGAPDFPRTWSNFRLRIGDAKDVDRETQAVREQLAAELRGMLAMGEQVRAKLDELQEKPASEWEPLIRGWRDETNKVIRRSGSRRVREYFILDLDLIADQGPEALSSLILLAARNASRGHRDACLDALRQLRQNVDKWVAELSVVRVTDVDRQVAMVQEVRTLLRAMIEDPDQRVLPVRRKFLETMDLLDKSVAETLHGDILDATSRAAALFEAVSDKTPEAKKLHAELDGLLQRFADSLRNNK